jgi:uncharacterized membrane protein YfcA
MRIRNLSMSSIIFVYIVIAVCAFLIGLSKGGLGGALGTIVTPLLALVMPAPVAVGLALPMLIAGDVFALYAHWGGWDRQVILAVLPPAIVGVIIGSLVISSLSSITLQHGLGIVVLLYILYKLSEKRLVKPGTPRAQRWQAPVLGSLTGFTSAVANAGGPSFTIYLLSLRLMPSVFVGTSVLNFALLNLIKLPAYLSAHILSAETIVAVAWTLPLIPFGVWTGVLLDKIIDRVTFERLILIFLAITGFLLLTK